MKSIFEKRLGVCCFVVCILATWQCSGSGAAEVVLDRASPGAIFEGVGAVSAGSSHLLFDYPEPQRSEILDFLFKPNFGAALQHLKVEIGGDGNSNAVAEPSHMHTPNDINFHRGVEWWLMTEAKRRNPNIRLSALAWNFPGWVKKANSQATADYLLTFLRGAKEVHGLDLDYLGIWNETQMGPDFIKRLRKTIQSNGFETKIVADDLVNDWKIADSMQGDSELRDAVGVIATHYPRLVAPSSLATRGNEWQKSIWSSEDGPWDDAWGAWGMQSQSYAEVLNRNYIGGRLTSTLLWSLVTGYPPNLGLPNSGLVRAFTPWSGHYEVMSPLWVVAHTTQFAPPGWRFMDAASSRTADAASYVTYHNGSDYSVVVETMAARRAFNLTFKVGDGLARGDVHVWRTNKRESFVRVANLDARDGEYDFRFEPDSVYTLTTTTGQTKGYTQTPPNTAFPLPFEEDFEDNSRGAARPSYFIPQNGAFEMSACRGARGGHCLRQVVNQVPIGWGAWGLSTEAGVPNIIGDPDWRDYKVSADVLIEESGYAMLLGRVVKNDCDGPLRAYQFRLYDTGRWELHAAVTNGIVASGEVEGSLSVWRRLAMEFHHDRISGAIDGKQVFSLEHKANAAGMAGFGSGWNLASFDNFTMEPVAADVKVITKPPHQTIPAFEPAVLIPTVADGAVTLRWTRVHGATSYRVRRSTKGEGPFEEELNVGDRQTHTFRNLQNGVRYFFWVLAVNEAGAGDPSYAQVATPNPAP